MFLLSKRIHSIFVLRLFNDPISMMFMYTSIYLLTCQSCSHKNLRYILSTVCFTLALNIKMNILLFAPGFAVVYFFNLGLIHSILHAILITGCGTILINLPFLLYHPENFIKAAFDFGRKFLYEWTVNWRFLDEATFLNESFHQILLALHLVVVTVFIYRVFMKIYSQKDNRNLTNSQIVLLLFTSNLIGITFSRSLHYQFLSWYHHSLPALVFLAENFKTRTCLLILGLIEFCWNVFPSTEFSSSMLFGCHLIILAAIFRKLDSLFDNLTVSSKKTE